MILVFCILTIIIIGIFFSIIMSDKIKTNNQVIFLSCLMMIILLILWAVGANI